MVCLTVLFFSQSRNFYCPTFQTFMVSVQGGQDISISYQGDRILVFHTRGRVVSAMERVRPKNLYTTSFTRNELSNFRLMALTTSALIYGVLLYLNPVKVQCYRITHVHNYNSFPSKTILWKILFFVFVHIKSDFVRYLIWVCVKSQLG